jgi:hypothetical protein
MHYLLPGFCSYMSIPDRLANWILQLQEKTRQKHFINLIPSENFTSQAVLDALGSPMQSMSIIRRWDNERGCRD